MKNCGLRKAYAGGGFVGMRKEEGDLLKAYEQRMAGTATSTPYASSMMVDQRAIEDQGRDALQTSLNSRLSDLTGRAGAGMSQRQKAAAMMDLQKSAGAAGLDTAKFTPSTSGLSAARAWGVTDAAADAAQTSMNFGLGRDKEDVRAGYIDMAGRSRLGFKQGGTVDGEGYIHGKKGVDKVPAEVAETGEPILVSHGERIVNKEQNEALEELAKQAGMSLDDYLESATGKPVGPTLKQGLRAAANGGVFIDKDGVIRETQAPGGTKALPPPQPGTQVAVRPTIDRTGGGGGAYIDPEGSIPGTSTRVNPNGAGPALSAPPPPPPTPPSAAYQAGQKAMRTLRSAGDWLKTNKGAIASRALDAAAVGLASMDAYEAGGFYNDPNVPFMDKLEQSGRTMLKRGAPILGGAVGTGFGTVASPTLLVNPVTGGMAGGAAGMAAVSGVDEKSDALKQWEAQYNRSQQPQVKANEQIMKDPNEGRGIITDLPTPEEKARIIKKAKYEQAKALNQTDDETAASLGHGTPSQPVAQAPTPENKNLTWLNSAGATNGLRTIQTDNGEVFAARDANGKLHVASGLNQTKAESEAARAKEAERMQKDLARQVDYFKRASIERDMAPDITDPYVRQNAMVRLAALNNERDHAQKVAQHSDEVGLRRGALDNQKAQLEQQNNQFSQTLGLQRDMFGEQKRQFNETQATARAVAEAQKREKRVKEVDELIAAEDFGSKKANEEWRDFMRANGFAKDGTALSETEIRKQLPALKAKFAANRKLKEGALDKTTLADITGGEVRDVRWSDVDTNRFGMPVLDGEGDPRKLSIMEYGLRKLPFTGYSDKIYVAPDKSRFRWSDAKQGAASFGEADMERLMKGK